MTTMPFAQVVEVAAHDVGDAVARLRTGELDAVLIRNALSPEETKVITEALEQNLDGFEKTDFPGPFLSHFFGRNLNLEDPDLTEYFVAERCFRRSLDTLGTRISRNLESVVLEALSHQDASVQYETAPGPAKDERHFFTTLREHKPGGYIPTHFDNEQTHRPTYRYIANLISGDIFSAVLTLNAAEKGGLLELIDIRAQEGQEAFAADDMRRRKVSLEGVAKHQIDVPPGTLVVVASGRLLHRVTPVGGTHSRWTLCSFLATSKDCQTVYCWG